MITTAAASLAEVAPSVARLRELGAEIHWSHVAHGSEVTGEGSDGHPALLAPDHLLDAGRAPGARGRVLRGSRPILTTPAWINLSGKYDPWLRLRARDSQLVVLADDGAQLLADRVGEFDGHVTVLGSSHALDLILAARRLMSMAASWSSEEPSHPPTELADHIRGDVQVVRRARRSDVEAVVSTADLDEAAAWGQGLVDVTEHLLWGKAYTAAADLAEVGSVLDPSQGDLLRALQVLAHLHHEGRVLIPGPRDSLGWSTSEDTPPSDSAVEHIVHVAAAELLRVAHDSWQLALSQKKLRLLPTARLCAAALELLFHREFHSDGHSSPLVENPRRWLAPLYESAMAPMLTGEIRQGRLNHEKRDETTLVVLPGAYPRFAAPVTAAMSEVVALHVETLDMGAQNRPFRWTGADPELIRLRLARAAGRPMRSYRGGLNVLQKADVVFADWADKAAMWASLAVPAGTRLVLRVHSVDALRSWLHLIDWSAVAEVICVSPHIRDLVVGQLGGRLDGVRVSVLPNVVAIADLQRPKVDEAGRTLCMVGWAQRVKDPLWAVEMLAQLRAVDRSWRLMLIGRDFAETMAPSGRRYAATFRRRALEPDVRDGIEYVDYTEDLAPVLARAGWVLSTSVRESWPVGPMEGVASGAVPVVREWPMFERFGAAAAMYPQDWVVETPEQAVERVLGTADDKREEAAAAAQRALRTMADTEAVRLDYQASLLGDVGELIRFSGRGQVDEALASARRIADGDRSDELSLTYAARAAARAGAMELEWRLRLRLLAVTGDPKGIVPTRRVLGRLRETSAQWAPSAPPVQPVTDPLPGRVAHVLKISLPHRQSGYSLRTHYGLLAQQRAGLDPVGITALDFPAEISSEDVSRVQGIAYHHLRRQAPAPDKGPADEYLNDWVAELLPVLQHLRPSVVHVHSGHRGFEAALVALVAARALGLPCVYEVRGFFESVWAGDSHPNVEEAETFRRRWETEVRCMQAAGAVVTLSESMRDDIVARGIAKEKVFIVPNGVDAQQFRPRARRDDLVRQWGLQDRYVFGYVSNLDHPREGQELLIEAAGVLREQGVPATALIVGSGKREQELRAWASSQGLEDVVVFTGHVPHEDVIDYYALCDVFVIPRSNERAARLVTPLKPFEAMALGIPLIVSDVPALAEIIGHGSRGRSFPVGDAASLAAQVAWVRTHPSEAAQMAEQARIWVEHERSWASNGARYRQVYESLSGPPTGLVVTEEAENGEGEALRRKLSHQRQEVLDGLEKLHGSVPPVWASALEGAVVTEHTDLWGLQFAQSVLDGAARAIGGATRPASAG